MAWKPGQSGNPKGRVPLAADRSRKALREAISNEVPAIVKKLVVLAKRGDVQAARTLLERVLPPVKAESAPIDLPDVAAATTTTEQAALIVKAVARGEIPADVGSQLLAGIGQAARVSEEINQLRHRLETLEEGIIR